MRSLEEACQEVEPGVRSLRHAIHQYPEPGFEEFKTQERIQEELKQLGLTPKACGKTGLIADMGQGDFCVALRADIDCLRMTEENHDLPYRSERDGFAHMCGHDGHTATLMGAAKLLAPMQDKLSGRIRLVFQPAEEGPGGAPVMIEDGALEGVDEIYGMHNWPQHALGTLNTIVGPCMATVGELEIVVEGKGGHAAEPHEAVDPVIAAAQIVTALQTVVSRSVHYEDPVVLSITTIHGGEAFNVIPDRVTLGGTTRALSQASFDTMDKRMKEIAAQVASAHGARATVEHKQMYPVLINTETETEHVRGVAREVFGEAHVRQDELPMLGAEDFAYFLQHRPGCYFFLGGAEEGRTNSACHATDYDFNDNILALGMKFWVRLVESRLGVQLYA